MRALNSKGILSLPDTSQWEKYHLEDLFDIRKGKRLTKAQMRMGSIPFVGATDNNNGLTAFIGHDPIHSGNTITVNYNGNGVAEAFYQPKAFWCSDDVNVLYPKFTMSTLVALFIATVIRLERYRFNYGRKWHLERMRAAVIKLPAKPDRTPDWQLMEEYMRTLPFSSVVDGVHGADQPLRPNPVALSDPRTWSNYLLGDLFDIRKGKRLNKADMTVGQTPFISALDNNNGLSAFIGQPAIHEGNTITINYDGNGVGIAFYQEHPFWCADSVNVLYPKFSLNPAIAMFTITVIRLEKYRFSYGRKWHLERMKTSTIRLPAKSGGEPDWDYMQTYIESLPFSSQLPSNPRQENA